MQRQKRTWLSPLEIVAVVLCFLYAGLLSTYLFASPRALITLAVCMMAIPSFASLTLLCGMRQIAKIFQWLVALGWGLLSLVLLGFTASCLRNTPRSDFFVGLALGIAAAGFAFLHSFIARHIRQRDEE
ncbi:hypothetical protein [Armatimonas sp.]|uniref:hypothetical protein n=1 Tax=Armatimonas sp. TaxID=1872638 RepID=UPI00286C80DB|nr:hypothetical protein [Armatimonas sp.]